MKKSPRLRTGLLCAAMAGLLVLGGCSPQEEPVKIDEPVLPKNDGAPAKLTVSVDGCGDSEPLRDKLSEIVEKYHSDFPETEISFTDSPDADVRLFSGGDAASTDWLMDLSTYKDAWTEEGTISNAANLIMRFKGGDEIYAIPCRYDQIMLYYRGDWFNEYNLNHDGSESEKVFVNAWSRLLEAEDKLGGRGRLAISEDVKPYLFDAMLWSFVNRSYIADASLAYYQPDGSTIFTLEPAEKAIDTYKQALDMDMGARDPLKAFIDGEAGMYLGRGTEIAELNDKMPGTPGVDWYAVGLPSGDSGKTVPLMDWTAWGVNKNTSEPEKAVHFLWYLTNADNNTHMYAQLRDIGVKPIYREVETYDPALAEGGWYGELDLITASGCRYACAPLVFGPEAGVQSPAFSRLLSELESGNITSKELLGQLDEEYTRLLKEYTAGGSLPWADKYVEVNP